MGTSCCHYTFTRDDVQESFFITSSSSSSSLQPQSSLLHEKEFKNINETKIKIDHEEEENKRIMKKIDRLIINKQEEEKEINSISFLCDDVLIEIFLYLDKDDIYSILYLNKSLYYFIFKSTYFWKIIFQSNFKRFVVINDNGIEDKSNIEKRFEMIYGMNYYKELWLCFYTKWNYFDKMFFQVKKNVQDIIIDMKYEIDSYILITFLVKNQFYYGVNVLDVCSRKDKDDDEEKGKNRSLTIESFEYWYYAFDGKIDDSFFTELMIFKYYEMTYLGDKHYSLLKYYRFLIEKNKVSLCDKMMKKVIKDYCSIIFWLPSTFSRFYQCLNDDGLLVRCNEMIKRLFEWEMFFHCTNCFKKYYQFFEEKKMNVYCVRMIDMCFETKKFLHCSNCFSKYFEFFQERDMKGNCDKMNKARLFSSSRNNDDYQERNAVFKRGPSFY